MRTLGLVLLGLVASGCSITFGSAGGNAPRYAGGYAHDDEPIYDEYYATRPKPLPAKKPTKGTRDDGVRETPTTKAPPRRTKTTEPPRRTKPAEPPQRAKPTAPPRRTRATPPKRDTPPRDDGRKTAEPTRPDAEPKRAAAPKKRRAPTPKRADTPETKAPSRAGEVRKTSRRAAPSRKPAR